MDRLSVSLLAPAAIPASAAEAEHPANVRMAAAKRNTPADLTEFFFMICSFRVDPLFLISLLPQMYS